MYNSEFIIDCLILIITALLNFYSFYDFHGFYNLSLLFIKSESLLKTLFNHYS